VQAVQRDGLRSSPFASFLRVEPVVFVFSDYGFTTGSVAAMSVAAALQVG
jgi:hypothetical protein